MTCLSYDERLHQLDLPRLELRRLHLDLIYCYKIVFGLVAGNIHCVRKKHPLTFSIITPAFLGRFI